MTRRIAHVAALHRRSWIVAEVGVYPRFRTMHVSLSNF
jgi:hypothetical protein